MRVHAKVRLSLNKQINSLIVSYNTFVKSSYDQFVTASIILRSKNKTEAMKYIDELTGKGSLNQHFKNMYSDFSSEFSVEELQKVLDNSLIPKVNKDEHKYAYYPDLDVSFYHREFYDYNLKEDDQFPISLVTSGEYIGSNVIESEVKNDSNIYNIMILDEKVEVMINGKRVDMERTLFESSVVHEVKKIIDYEGVIATDITGDGWYPLTNGKLNDVVNSSSYFIEDGNHYMITNKNIKKTELAQVWGLYLYRETEIEYFRRNSDYCVKALEVLMNSNRINEFKTKSLVQLLKAVDYDLVQEYLNYILNRKNSKELALLGLVLVEKGYHKGWNEEVVKNFKEFSKSDKELTLTYIVDDSLEYSLIELLGINKYDKTLLHDEHRKLVEQHYKDRESMINYIETVTGRITASGRREKVKRTLEVDTEVGEFNKLCNKYVGHVKSNVRGLNMDALKKRYEIITRLDELDKIMIIKLDEHRSQRR